MVWAVGVRGNIIHHFLNHFIAVVAKSPWRYGEGSNCNDTRFMLTVTLMPIEKGRSFGRPIYTKWRGPYSIHFEDIGSEFEVTAV
jgi:hypothetical protein